MEAQINANKMKTPNTSLTQRDVIRDKHREIFQKYATLLKKEAEENSLRAKHIGKLYYARVIAGSMSPAMDPFYVLRIINNQLRERDNRD